MSAASKVLSYKGRIIDVDDLKEKATLLEIYENVEMDLMGEILRKRLSVLIDLTADSGYFYAPYVPLMSMSVNVDDDSPF